MSKRKWISLSVLVISFLISVLMFMLDGRDYKKLSYLYYHELDNRLVVENRYVLLPDDYDKKVKMIIDELFLGPHSVFNRKIVDYNFTFSHLKIDDKTLYLDLPLEFINYINENELIFDDVVGLIKKNLLRNIPGIKEIVMTVNREFIGFEPLNEAQTEHKK